MTTAEREFEIPVRRTSTGSVRVHALDIHEAREKALVQAREHIFEEREVDFCACNETQDERQTLLVFRLGCPQMPAWAEEGPIVGAAVQVRHERLAMLDAQRHLLGLREVRFPAGEVTWLTRKGAYCPLRNTDLVLDEHSLYLVGENVGWPLAHGPTCAMVSMRAPKDSLLSVMRAGAQTAVISLDEKRPLRFLEEIRPGQLELLELAAGAQVFYPGGLLGAQRLAAWLEQRQAPARVARER